MATKQKAKAAPYVCQSKDETMDAIRVLGDEKRALLRVETEINDQIASIAAARKDEIDARRTKIETLSDGIQCWCEAHRRELTAHGGKEANLVTGLVKWRQRPPSVSIRSVEKVLETLRGFGLGRFIRTRDEPNKEAMLADPTAVAGIAGITIVKGVEDFVIEPFEVEVT
jgi:phage host-nuclease inhibitor protein Gam